jgi:hypothetical protein
MELRMNKFVELPDPKESAILLLLLVGTRPSTTRVRLSETTLKRLWLRHRLKDEFLADVTEWLFRAGWALFYAKSTFALVKTTVVTDWPRLSSKRMDAALSDVEDGRFDFANYTDFFNAADSDVDE